ncbi:hypothetical protein D3C85_632180 [compost metagenome]
MHQAANPAVGALQLDGRIADQFGAGFADVGEHHRLVDGGALQAKHQAGHVAGDALEPRLALLQGGAGTAALGDIGEEHHQVFRPVEAQETQRHVHRQAAAVGAQALALETRQGLVAAARQLPQAQPAVHMQTGLQGQ